jgi:tRNA(Ile)-lysidine synthase
MPYFKYTSRVEQIFFEFVATQSVSKKKFLLGFSGGPDSLAIFHLLLKFRNHYPLNYGAAYVDHGWRIESSQEEACLKALAAQHNVPFHSCRLDPKVLQGNLEDACRNERLRFFKSLCMSQGYQAVMLGHHGDDQAETVLKRVLEGANLLHLTGLKSVTALGGMEIWRPLLPASKQEILAWLGQQNLQGFEDETNKDHRFLRARMRSSIIPQLSREFGKNILPSLKSIAQESAELEKYFARITAKYFEKIHSGPWGMYMNLSDEYPMEKVELAYIIRRFCLASTGKAPSREGIAAAINFLLNGAANKSISLGRSCLHVDRRRLFLWENLPEPIEEPIVLHPGEWISGCWDIRVDEPSGRVQDRKNDWESGWKGECEAVLPSGHYVLASSKNECPESRRLGKLLSYSKVPAFLRSSFPVIWQNGKIVHEFLTGRETKTSESHSKLQRIILKFRKQVPVEDETKFW